MDNSHLDINLLVFFFIVTIHTFTEGSYWLGRGDITCTHEKNAVNAKGHPSNKAMKAKWVPGGSYTIYHQGTFAGGPWEKEVQFLRKAVVVVGSTFAS